MKEYIVVWKPSKPYGDKKQKYQGYDEITEDKSKARIFTSKMEASKYTYRSVYIGYDNAKTINKE